MISKGYCSISNLIIKSVRKILQFMSAVFMAFIFAILLKELFEKRTALNFFSNVFMGGILCFTFVSFFWILSNKKIRRRRGYRIVDSGRGLFSFLLIGLFVFFSPIILFFFPENPKILKNIQFVFRILADCGKILWLLVSMGSIFCLIRKFLNLTFNSNCSTIIITKKRTSRKKQ